MSYSVEQIKCNPYEKCPIYETENFVFRKVQEDDAEDLLQCYSDPVSAKIFNSDNCTSNFIYSSLDEMKDCIKFWLDAYENKYYVRFSIVDKEINKATGTIEFFAKQDNTENTGKVGVLRLDLSSKYEKESIIIEILNMIEQNFYDCFEVESIITKAIPEAKERIKALKIIGYNEVKKSSILPYDSYHIRVK